MQLLKNIFLFLASCIGVIVIIGFCIHFLFINKQFKQLIPSDKKNWIHRGLYDNVHVFENTIQAFDSAQKKQISGIEFDVFYIDSINDFVVSHDLPNGYGLPQLLLSDVLNRYKSEFYYWIDLKNLSANNQSKIANRFKKIISIEIKSKIFIESSNASALGFLANNNFNTIYWIQYNRMNQIVKMIKKNWIKFNFLRYDFKGCTVGISMADDDFFDAFENIPKFIFHVYTPELFESVKEKKNVSVFLTDFILNPK